MATNAINKPQLATHFLNSSSELTRIISPFEGYEQQPLVSLEEAIHPLISIVQDIEQMVQIVKKQCKQLTTHLLLDESASIMLYTLKWKTDLSSFYFIFNETLCSHDRENLQPWFLYLRLFIHSLSKLPSISFHTVYYGMKMDLTREYSIGKRFIWWNFIICTSSIQHVEKSLNENEPRTIFIIECDSAKDISIYTFDKNENEIIIYPAKQFQVISLFDCKNQLKFIQLKEFQLYHPLIQISHLFSTNNSTKLTTNPISNGIYSSHQLKLLIDQFQDHSRIDLIKQKLTDDHMNIVVTHAINKKQCRKLFLSENRITSIGSLIIAKALNNNTTLELLSLSYNHLCDEGIEHLTKILSLDNSKLETLSLHATDITDQGAEYLSSMLKKNKTLTWLHLGENKIGDQGVQFLVDALAVNSTLKVLALSRNELISDKSINSLVEMLKHNESLETLWIKDCNVSSNAATKLQQFIQQSGRFFVLSV